MDLMTLLAKLTLDKEQYDEGLKEAEKSAENLTLPQPTLPKPDNQPFNDGLKEAEETGNWFKEVMSGVWEGVRDAIITTGIVGVVGSIIGAMRQGISLAVNNGKAISDSAKNLQISTRSYQEYEYVLGKSNLRVKDLSTALKRMDELKGGKKLSDEQKKWLGELGINAENAADKEKLLAETIESLANYKGSDKGLIVDWLFGSNQNWTGFFDQTSSEIGDLKKEADDLGYIMSDESIENAVKFNEATERINTQLDSIKRAFGESILPLITEAIQGVEKIIAFFSGGGQSLSEKWAGDDKKFAEELLTIEGTSAAAQTLADKLIAMGSTSEMTAEQYAVWKGTAEELIRLVPTLGDLIDVETGQINANSAGIQANIKEWENLAKQKALQSLKEKKYQDIVEKNEDLINKSIEANKKAAEAEKLRYEAAGKFSQKMQEYGLGSLDLNGDIDQQINDVMERLAAGGDQYESEQLGLGVAFKEYGEALTEAGKAQEEVGRLKEELSSSEEEYKSWVSAADEMFGTAAEQATTATSDVEKLKNELASLPLTNDIKIRIIREKAFPNAIGNSYVPYDNYPALLHRGERVLTATEARRERGSNVDLSGLEDRMISAIRKGMTGVSVRSYLNGNDITDDVDRNMIRKLKARRFAT